MKMTVLILAAIVALPGGNENEPVDYKTAYQRALTGDKPLLVLVTAEWCPPCKTMKNKTIPELMSQNAFQDFHYATVDLGKDEGLARKLIGTRGVPQLILYEKKDDRWERRYLRGAQTVETVRAFIQQNQPVRTADATAVAGK